MASALGLRWNDEEFCFLARQAWEDGATVAQADRRAFLALAKVHLPPDSVSVTLAEMEDVGVHFPVLQQFPDAAAALRWQ